MSETEQGTAEEVEPSTVPLSDASNDDLADLINSGSLSPDREEEPDLGEDPPQQDPLADEDTNDEEEVQEDTDEVEAEPDALSDEGKAEEEAEPEPDEHQLRLNEAEATAKHFETVAGRLGGKLGFIENQNKTLSEQVRQLSSVVQRLQGGQSNGEAPEFTEQWDRTAQAPPAQTPQKPSVDQNAVYHSANAVRQALADFSNSNPDVMTEQDGKSIVDPGFVEEIRVRYDELLNLAQSGDAMTAQASSAYIYAEALSKVKRDRAVAARQEMERRRADQAASLKQKKRAQASAGTSTKRASPRARTIRSPSDLTDAELKRAINSRAGLD